MRPPALFPTLLLLLGDDTSRVDGLIQRPFDLPDLLAQVGRVSHGVLNAKTDRR
jgi:hypothetical protein